MGIVHELVKDIPIPRMVKVRQRFDDQRIDLAEELPPKLRQDTIRSLVQPGMEIAIAVGSRGVDQIPQLTAMTAAMIREQGAEPFIVPSMGSHGGASASGQKDLLRHLGVTEESTGAKIRSSMQVVKLGELPNGLPVYIDQYAAEADGIVVINRIKPHTAFRGPIESGLMKMMSIGLGKQKGAEACHQLGFKSMAEHVPAMARMMMAKTPILFGVATVENAYDQVARVEVIKAENIEAAEAPLLEEAKQRMPRICFDPLDVLVIDEIGKNISGDGMDPNVTGRYPTPYAHGGPDVNKMVVLRLTSQTEGNANGIGTADFATKQLVQAMRVETMYANGLTSTVVAPTKIPMTLANDREAIQAAIKTSNILRFEDVRLVRIKNTLRLDVIEVSEALATDAQTQPEVDVVSDPYALDFDSNGNLL